MHKQEETMPRAKIGVIGGTGLYDIEGLTGIEEVDIDTPFGKPSDIIVIGKLNNINIAFLPRHGHGHRIMPSELPNLANIYALKSLGVERIIAVNSAGSLNEDIHPGTLVIPDQVIDWTRGRKSTYFGNGIVGHVSFAEPFCFELADAIYKSSVEVGAPIRNGGTYITMEGPAFSTKAESKLYRSWGVDIIGMTVIPEAKLAREAEICYCSIALVTDYDCWKERTDPVTADVILDCMRNNVEITKKIIKRAVAHIPSTRKCDCGEALNNSIVTSPDKIPPEQKEKLKLIIGKYIK
jgi:5'-methylthioadenosine phosphorylase